MLFDFPPNSRKFVKTVGGVGVEAPWARGARERPSAAIEAPIPATNPRRERSALMRRVRDRSSGPQQAQP